MIALLLFVVFGIVFGYFATLNTVPVTIRFLQYTWTNIPLYLLVLSSFGFGLLYSTLYYLIRSVGQGFRFGKKERQLADSQKEIAELTKEMHKMELENTRLKAKNGEEVTDEDSI